MKFNKLLLIDDALTKIEQVTQTTKKEIVEALVGVAWSEEQAGEILQIIIEPE